MSVAIALDDVTITYGRRPAVHHLSGCFQAGSATAVVGPNGAGKSTLLKAIAGALRPAEGRICVDGATASRHAAAARLAYLPQQAEIDPTFPIAVRDVVLSGAWARIGLFGRAGAVLRAEADAALAAVGLHGFAHRPFGDLSVGQRQRVLFARVLLQDAPAILLDEPFAAIDAKTTADLLQLVARWRDERRTVVAVLHDLNQARAHFPQALLLAREPIAWGDAATTLSEDNLRRARAMAEAWNDDARPCSGSAA